MINTDFTFNKKIVSYEVSDDGYDIYLGSIKWIGQHGEYGKPVDSSKSYEENCIAQIEEICKQTGIQEDETEQRLSTLEEILDNILTNVIPVMAENEVK